MIKSRSSMNPLSASCMLYTFPRFFQLLRWTSQGKFVETTGKSVLKIIKLPNWWRFKGLVVYYPQEGGSHNNFAESLEDFQTDPPVHPSFLKMTPHKFYIL